MGSPETGKFSTALRVSVPQSSFGVVATPWSLDGAQSPEAQLRRALAQGFAHRIGEVGDQRPAEIAALGALARVEALRALALDGPERAAMEALDGVLLAHTVFFGCGGPPVLPPKGEIRQSVEYLGWTFSPRMRAMALFAAIAASPKPMVMSVILPSYPATSPAA